ncbi:hypothetical protein PF005_g278 [Phytophthora fragariae]|uniref:Uncharacterized protein n=2 Tax=Phytophthora TaxID=4783 RepID=A0A6A3U2R9_9STRA|nr:hypothetical protein PF003_g26365 [Phytophthora fragariae]KAE9023061.1 hypothetical protein PR001_g13002 [Phytophthora rubi]KAE8950237.1 hypothetical protein PF009_g226 [Phytophthora fragariae]KAE9048159.1 hypothetical protein PR002_g636 [Phytophthora rubi]KAE9130795.1 hypothetical protein PF010_g3715 [Phytophthora fragariae]
MYVGFRDSAVLAFALGARAEPGSVNERWFVLRLARE